MGKSLRIMAAVSLFLMSLFGTAWGDDYIIGDADGNGSSDIFDALIVAKYDAGLKTAYDFLYLASGDTDCNGKVDIFDALRIAEFDAKIITGFECNWTFAGDIPSYDPGSEPAYNENTVFSLNTDPENPLLAVIKTDNGWGIDYFGTKNADGTVKSVNFICSETPKGDIITNRLDDYGRIVQAGTGNGKIISFDWETRIISMTEGYLPCPQSVQSDARKADNFSKEECKAFAENLDLLCMTSSMLISGSPVLWQKIAGYLMNGWGCPAIHTLLLEDICCVCKFSSKEIERCYGGIGSKCDSMNRFVTPEGIPWAAPMRKNYDTCKVTGSMSVGSILHDRCCIQTDNRGFSCIFPNMGTDECKEEWDEAVANTLCSSVMNSPRQWAVTWGPYQCGNIGDDTNAQLYAPPGTRVNPIYQNFCEFGCIRDENGQIIMNIDPCGEYCNCAQQPQIQTQPSITLEIIGSNTLQVGEKTTLRVTFVTPANDARAVAVYGYTGIGSGGINFGYSLKTLDSGNYGGGSFEFTVKSESYLCGCSRSDEQFSAMVLSGTSIIWDPIIVSTSPEQEVTITLLPHCHCTGMFAAVLCEDYLSGNGEPCMSVP